MTEWLYAYNFDVPNKKSVDILEKYLTFSNQNKRIWLIKCIYFTYLKNCSSITNIWWWKWQWIWIKCEKISNIRMCIQLVGQYLKFSIEYFVYDLFMKFVEQFHWDFQWIFCNMYVFIFRWSECCHVPQIYIHYVLHNLFVYHQDKWPQIFNGKNISSHMILAWHAFFQSLDDA